MERSYICKTSWVAVRDDTWELWVLMQNEIRALTAAEERGRCTNLIKAILRLIKYARHVQQSRYISVGLLDQSYN